METNMKTTFKGIVNDKEFDNRENMNVYIEECISKGYPITTLYYSTSCRAESESTKPDEKPQDGCCHTRIHRGLDAIRNAQEKISWLAYINKLGRNVPDPYDSVVGYVVPFIHEDIQVTKSSVDYIINDLRDKLKNRMEFLENEVFSQIRTWKYDEKQVVEWLEDLFAKFSHKLEWANKRISLINSTMNEISDKFIAQGFNEAYFLCFHDLYEETAGFCSAIMDIIDDLIRKITNMK